MKKKQPRDWQCFECGHLMTATQAERATWSNGCTKCGGVDIDLAVNAKAEKNDGAARMHVMTREKEMAALLRQKLTKEEFLELYEILDGDPPAGPFYCVMGDVAVTLAPEEFVSDIHKEKVAMARRAIARRDDAK